MHQKLSLSLVLAFFSIFTLLNARAQTPTPTPSENTLLLEQNWEIQDATLVKSAGARLSKPQFATPAWIPTTVPSTVLAALVKNQAGFDPFYGMNFRTLPGTDYPVAGLYYKMEIPSDSPFAHDWWYRTNFELPKYFHQKAIDLHLEGVNYTAEVWLNGKKIAGSDLIEGFYRTYSLDITHGLVENGANTLAIKVSHPHIPSLVANWVDWNPTPQDKNMGLWRGVYLSAHEQVSIQHPMVTTHFDLPATDVAHLSVEAIVKNRASTAVTGTLQGTIENVSFAKKVTLAVGESRTVILDSTDFPQLNFKNARLWWPAQMGSPELYSLQLQFQADHRVHASDSTQLTFGIREVTSELLAGKSRLFKINGKPLLIRGGGWSSDLFLRFSRERMQKDFQFVKQLNLNTIRLEGMSQPQYFYDLADQFGILIMPGWVCCNSWQNSKAWDDHTKAIANASIHDELLELRAHPSVFTFLYGSDESPVDAVEAMYLQTAKSVDWPNPILSAASNETTPGGGPTGVKMNGPYDYVGPSYWLTDTQNGGAFGFNTETSPGPAIPTLESLKKFIPADHLWPIDAMWNFHAGSGLVFTNVNLFTAGLTSRYGAALTIEDYERKAQMMAYDGERAMFEAHGRNKYNTATGIVQWMLNNAWPSMIWHLYDYYFQAGGGFYGVRKANEPIHLQYSYDDRSVVLVNSTYAAKQNLKARAQVFDFSLRPLFDQAVNLASVDADSTQRLFTIPELANLTKTYFVKLTVDDGNGVEVSNNFYWLSTQAEIYDWAKTDYTHTAMTQDADLTMLNTLPQAKLVVTSSIDVAAKTGSVTVTNSTSSLALFTEMRLVNAATGAEVLPTLWDDNYITLLPGETRVVSFSFPLAEVSGELAVVVQ
jgi:exo-1,4-beta-D-glucosaminidase